ncbi:MAG TPA: hypothetical protein VHV10_02565 [Ktedonobacteraceae bacterium]|jgi:hypothetical protein|nr:hypothetical protein [Ktedonobacteraceae bacterium]
MQPEKDSSHPEVSHEAEEGQAVDLAPPIGRTSRPVYRSVVLGSLLVLAMMITAIAHGGVAVAAAIPGGLFVNQTVGTLYIQGFAQHIAISDNSLFAVTRINLLVATQVTATIKINVPGFGPVTIKAFIAKLIIHGLTNKTAIPGTAPPSLVNIDILFDSANIEGLSITIFRG